MKLNDFHSVGSLYEIYAASDDKKVNSIGIWNESMIVSDGTHVEHWLNGKMIVKYDRSSQDFKDKIKASKFKNTPDYGLVKEGPILLQDHGSVINYRNIKIKTIK